MSEWGIDSPHFKSLKDQIILYNLELISNLVADHFQSIFISSRYITPLRAAADRYYRIQNTSIEELDPNGSNLAMFLYAKKPSEIDEINEWLRMEVGFSIKIIGSHGHASIFIIDNDGNNATNIADTGFGISQVLPVLIQIWQQTKKRNFAYRAIKAPVIIVIEQPELHLHPKMQSRVGDVFCRAIKLAKDKGIDLRILIETHSKEIIDAIGKSIDQGILKKEDAAIYLVDKTKDVNVTQAYFDDGGFLDNWPYGFFDGV